MKKLAIILGTRPEIIKMSPLVEACRKSRADFFIIHTGQHYSPELDKQILEDLEMPKPEYHLGIGGKPYRKQVGMMMSKITKILLKEKPDWVIVQGDTTSVLAGALAALRCGIRVAHHEAGLRSHDTTMLEETNRVITDHISDLLFAPTADAYKNLEEEGIDKSRIHLVGNTIVDVVLGNAEKAEKKSNKLAELSLVPRGYVLASAHRAENVDVRERLLGIMEGLRLAGEKLQSPIVFSLHPRTRAKMEEFGISPPANIQFINPVGFLDMLNLEKNAKLIMTDSGGLQEEAFILRIPCVTMRDNTERPETVTCGANVVAGVNPQNIASLAEKMAGEDLSARDLGSPFGDGSAAQKILEVLNNS